MKVERLFRAMISANGKEWYPIEVPYKKYDYNKRFFCFINSLSNGIMENTKDSVIDEFEISSTALKLLKENELYYLKSYVVRIDNSGFSDIYDLQFRFRLQGFYTEGVSYDPNIAKITNARIMVHIYSAVTFKETTQIEE